MSDSETSAAYQAGYRDGIAEAKRLRVTHHCAGCEHHKATAEQAVRAREDDLEAWEATESALLEQIRRARRDGIAWAVARLRGRANGNPSPLCKDILRTEADRLEQEANGD